MSNNFNTHIITNYSDAKKGSVLSRTSDGMVIGRRVGCIVAWGEDPRQQEQRVFTDETWALCFLRKVADWDATPKIGQYNPCAKDVGGAPIFCPLPSGHLGPCGRSDDPAWQDRLTTNARIEEVDGDRRIVTTGVTQ